MLKAMIFLKRREDMSLDDFRSWWIEQHRLLAEKLPGLRRHAFNLLEQGPYDAVVEQWFHSAEAMEASYQTEIGREVAADSRRHVSARERVIVQEFVFEIARYD